jgi:hypothetical protein
MRVRVVVKAARRALAVVLTLLPGAAWAQSTIAGVVTDTTGAILPGVTVEASSPVLIEKVRTVVTNGDGRYTIVDVRPGVYAVTFTLPGFNTVKREGIEVAANVSVPVNAELRVGAIEETVTVSGATPVVDVQQATRRQVLTRQVLDALPTSRTYGASGVIVPGMKLTKPDMGGIASFSQAYIQGRGKGAEQNAFEVDGMDMRTIRGCPSTQYTNFAMVQEVTIQTSANSAETSGGGVRINMIPREGGNTFHGDIYVGGMNHAWQSSNITAELKASGLPTPDATRRMIEAAPAFGGPLLKDKLWFFGVPYRLLRVQLAPAGAHYFDGRPGYNTTRTDSASLRLTWQATQRNKATLYYDRAWKGQSNVNTGNSGPGGEYGPGGIDWGTATYVWEPLPYFLGYAKWTSTVTNRLMIEGGLSWQGYDSRIGAFLPGVDKPIGTPEWYAGAPRLDFVRGTLKVAPPGGINSYIQPARVLSSATSYVTGSHNFKTGVQWKWGHSEQISQPGIAGLTQRYRNGLPDAVDVSASPFHTNSVLDADLGVYAQDSWTIRRLTVNPGVRFEYFAGGIAATSMEAGRFLPARSVPALKPTPNFFDIAPRFSVVYDLLGNARTAVKFSANKYVATLGALYFNPYNPVGAGTDRRNWFDCDLIPGTSICSGVALGTNGDGIAQNNEIGPSSNNSFGFAAPRRADPNLKREYDWDYSVSVQHQLVSRVSVVGAWYHTRFYNLQRVKNVLVSPSDYAPFQATSPLNNGELITIYNLNRARQGLVDNVVTNSEINHRVYNGFEASIQARLPSGAVLLGGWSTERTVSTTCDTNSPNQFRYCDQSGGLYQELGSVPTMPFRNEYKLGITYPLPWKLQAGLSYVSLPGGSAGSIGYNDYMAVNWSVPVNLFPGGRTEPVTVNLVPPGTRYLKQWNQVDINVKRIIRVGRFEMQPSLDIFNLINSSVVLTQLQAFGPSLGVPTSTLQGRFMKLSVLAKF